MSGVRLGGLWPKQSQNGEWYLEGAFGQAQIRIFENNYTRGEKDPSHVMYVSEKPMNKDKKPQAKPQGGFAPKPQAARLPYKDQTQPAYENEDPGPGDGDLPF